MTNENLQRVKEFMDTCRPATLLRIFDGIFFPFSILFVLPLLPSLYAFFIFYFYWKLLTLEKDFPSKSLPK